MNTSVFADSSAINLARIRADFPILAQYLHGNALVYLDNAATTQKPSVVIEAITEYYQNYNANIHRGIHALAEQATQAYENTRQTVRNFINASHSEEIIFTRGTTESINLVASSYGRQHFGPGVQIIVSGMEHHSNLVPWQMAAQASGASIAHIPILADGSLDLDVYKTLLAQMPTALVALVYVSNALGLINPVAEMIALAHAAGAVVLLDGAQATAHLPIDVKALDCDFYAFSSHKVYGPTGIGVLYGKKDLLESMPAYQGGGEMIGQVSYQNFTCNVLPYKFEAGTPNIADTIAFKAALDYVSALGHDAIMAHENALLAHGRQRLSQISGLRLVGDAEQKAPVFSFVIDGLHPYDIGVLLDAKGIAIRTGQHCTQPLMESLGLEGTARASFAVYNTIEEVDFFADSLAQIVKKHAKPGRA